MCTECDKYAVYPVDNKLYLYFCCFFGIILFINFSIFFGLRFRPREIARENGEPKDSQIIIRHYVERCIMNVFFLASHFILHIAGQAEGSWESSVKTLRSSLRHFPIKEFSPNS